MSAEQRSLREAWTDNAEAWIRWARTPGHDAYSRFHRRQFLALVPPAGRLTIDIGCGDTAEDRWSRIPLFLDIVARSEAFV